MWPVIVLAGLVVLYFSKILFFKKIFLIGDLYHYYALRALIVNAIKSAVSPIWTPYLLCGFPLMSNPECGMFDPINMALFYFLPPVTAFNTLICLYFLLAGLFTYLFCRSIRLDSFSSLFSAIIFIFGGAFGARLMHINMIMSMAFMPLTFLTINLFFKTRKIKFIFLSGLSMGFSFLPGNPQVAVYAAFASMCYFFFSAFFEKDEKRFSNLYRNLFPALLILKI